MQMLGHPRQPVVLIVTFSADNDSVQRVMDAVAARDGIAYRFDTDRFPTELQIACHYGGGKAGPLRLTCQGEDLDLRTVTAVWYRRVAIGQRIPATMDPRLRRPAIDESHAAVYGLITSLDAFHLDQVQRVRRAESKQLQLKIAHEVGLRIPRTLITNQPDAVRQFARECEQGMIMKTLTSFSVYEADKQHMVFTNVVGHEDLEHVGDLRYCPAIFQERLPKALELRATIVGERVFTASIDSQQSENARVDWRRDGIGLIDSWQHHALPGEVERALLEVMHALRLNYGAADLILTPQGEYVFLEVNPNGEFLWLDKHLGLPLSSAIADLLAFERNDRR